MWKDAAMLTIACVLFINMGLEEAIRETVGFGFKIFSCPKCLSFWSVLVLNIIHGYPAVQCIAVSFICSYSALWLSLVYDVLSNIYNRIYDEITNQADAKNTDPETLSDEGPKAGADAMP